MLRLVPSDPLYPEWSQLLTDYAALINPLCWWNLLEVDTGSPEYKATVTVWRERVAQLFAELTR